MSIKLMAGIWEHPALKAGTPILEGNTTKIQDKKLRLMKFVLLALADNANDDGVCWPRVATVAAKCNLTERYARALIGALDRNQWLDKAPRYAHTDGDNIRQTSNQYTLNVNRILEVDASASRGGVSVPAWGGGSRGQGESSVKTSVKTTTGAGARCGRVFAAWQDNMPGTMSASLVDQINDLVSETSEDSVMEGIKVAVANGRRKLTYVRGVALRHASGEGAPAGANGRDDMRSVVNLQFDN